MNSDTAELIGEQIAQALTKSMAEHTDSAKEKLDDDDIVGFGLVALRDPDGSAVQSVSQRAIDPEVVRESDRDPEEVVDIIHSQLCDVWDEEVAEA
jgi:hypothetical protein